MFARFKMPSACVWEWVYFKHTAGIALLATFTRQPNAIRLAHNVVTYIVYNVVQVFR